MAGIVEKGIEAIIKASGYFTSLIVLLIVLFLFREGISFLGSEPIEEGYALYTSKSNPVQKVTATQIKDIFDQKILLWSELGGSTDSIRRYELDDLKSIFSESELEKNFENGASCVRKLTDSIPGSLILIPKAAIASEDGLHKVHTDKIDLTEFLSGKEWFPTAKPAGLFGSLPLFLGTLLVSLMAILIALPFGMAGAIYLAEIADQKIRNILKPLIELLSGIPSVVYGFFGLVVIVPWIQKTLGLPVGESALAGSIVLAIMALPTIITVSEDSIRTIPSDVRQASLALGASQWQTIVRVLIPYAASGIGAAVILGIGRAMGETMAVLMVTGNAAVIPHGLAHPVRTIPATIAAELGEAPYGGLHFKALFALGCILFLITFITNYIVDSISRKRKLK
ncbi:MAG: phosphate ABC transporter permease subunit PstC [Saprospiraceae bacterium]|nr:phosphate ABC transporter permease subunit PstC [Saprospiraceae bacterium]